MSGDHKMHQKSKGMGMQEPMECMCGLCKLNTREWIGLTDEAIWLEYQRFWPFHPAEEPTLAKDIVKFARAIEAKLKEKNT